MVYFRFLVFGVSEKYENTSVQKNLIIDRDNWKSLKHFYWKCFTMFYSRHSFIKPCSVYDIDIYEKLLADIWLLTTTGI